MELFGLALPGGRGQIGGDGDEFRRALHPDDRHMMARFHRAANDGDFFPVEYRIVRPDGQMLWVSGRGRVIARAPDGKAERLLNIVMDITERKKAEDHVQLLMGEISHRSKNLLSVVQAIAIQTARTAESLSEFQATFVQRLRGMAASHNVLVQQDWRGALLQDLAREQLALFTKGEERRLFIKGPKAMLTAQAAQAIGLAFHELGTNAIKHGAWSVPEGRVELSWSWEGDVEANKLSLSWIERGGPPVGRPASQGFGHVVIERMVAQSTRGEVSMQFNPVGLIWTVLIPIESLVLA